MRVRNKAPIDLHSVYARWTKEDYLLLDAEWAHLSLHSLARRLGRKPSAVYARAKKRGLCKRECWPSINQLSASTGYDRTTLTIILKWAGVAVKAARVNPNRKNRQLHKTFVDRDDAIAAVESWCSTENLRQAATARGVNSSWLKRRLAKAGVYVNKYLYRYKSEDIDRAVAEFKPYKRVTVFTEEDVRMIRASREANTTIAKRLGVSESAVREARKGITYSHVKEA